jgi:peptidoglycan/LPS O-acetylase OafA/YrhL
MPYFGVSWSLCVEEHFYLMIAPLLLLSTRRAGWVILAVYMLLPGLFRTWLHGEINYEQTHFRWDQCGAGVVLAGLSLHWSAMWKFLCRYAVVFSCCGVVVVLLNLYWRIAGIDGIQAWSFGMWSLISMTWVLLANSSEYWQRQAGCWLTRYIADRSYSLYLVHIEAIVIVKKLELTSFTSWITCWIVSLIAAEILYRVVERPWLKLRDWVCENRFVSPAPVAKETVAEKVVLTPSCQR